MNVPSASLDLLEPFGALWRSIVGLLGSAQGTAARPVRLTSDVLRAAMDRILSANDRADLVDLIDEYATDEGAMSQLQAAAEPAKAQQGVEILRDAFAEELDMPSLVRTLGPAGAYQCDEGRRAYRELASEIVALVERSKQARTRSPATTAAAVPITLRTLIYGTDLPLAARRHFLAVLRSLIGAIAIARAEEKGRVEPWLGLALGEVFAEGPSRALDSFRRLLRDGAGAVADDQRLGDELNSRVARWKSDAKASSEEVYFPLDRPDAEG